MEKIYLDHAATSPLHPDAAEAMMPYYSSVFGNPSSIHHFGREARRGVDEARVAIAREINASFDEIIFTSGGTEADNMAVTGYALANRHEGAHLVTTKVEHHGVLHTFEFLESQGFTVTYLDVNAEGTVSVEQVKEVLRDDTILVSVMFGNNEVGTLQPVKEIGCLLAGKKPAFHTDAVQAFGIVPMDVQELQVDFLAASGHKINGPNGTGFLYARKGLKMSPLIYGGEQEKKRRAGTENVPGIAGLKIAAEKAAGEREQRTLAYQNYRSIMLKTFEEADIDYAVNGPDSAAGRLPHILNVSFPGLNVESILVNLDLEGIAVSSGSACTAGSIEPSHVLTAMFDDKDRSHSAVRFSFGLGNTEEQVERAANTTVKVVQRLSKL